MDIFCPDGDTEVGGCIRTVLVGFVLDVAVGLIVVVNLAADVDGAGKVMYDCDVSGSASLTVDEVVFHVSAILRKTRWAKTLCERVMLLKV